MVGSGEAKAGLGIIVTQTTVTPVKDPMAEFDFKLSLAPNNELIQGDNITLKDVPDFNGTAEYVYKVGSIDYSQFFTIVPTEVGSTGFYNIELLFSASPGAIINMSPTDDLPIGDLIVETNVAFPPPADSPLFNPIDYTTHTHFTNSGQSNPGTGGVTTPLLVSVPEPASVALVGIGLGLASGWLAARGRRRRLSGDLSGSADRDLPPGRSSRAPKP